MTNPFTKSEREAAQAVKHGHLQRGSVTTSIRLDDSDGFIGSVFGDTIHGQTTPSPLVVPVHGDAYAPPEGYDLLYGELLNGRVALGAFDDNDTSHPPVEPGERVLSHPVSDSYVKFNADGSIDVYGDSSVTVDASGDVSITPSGDVNIGSASTQAITDVSLSTTTDADGHVTDVSLTVERSNSVYL